MVNIGIQFVVVREAWRRQDATLIKHTPLYWRIFFLLIGSLSSTDSKPFTLIEVITVSKP